MGVRQKTFSFSSILTKDHPESAKCGAVHSRESRDFRIPKNYKTQITNYKQNTKLKTQSTNKEQFPIINFQFSINLHSIFNGQEKGSN